MNSFHISEMAASIAAATGAPLESITTALNIYWNGKIAAIWSREDMLETAFEQGYAITDEIADNLLTQIEADMDAELGICWLTLRTALQDADHAAWFKEVAPVEEAGQFEHWLTDTTLEKYVLVYGRFMLWRWLEETHEALQEFFGKPEDPCQKGNLVEALITARRMAEENEGEPVFIACLGERSQYDDAPDLAVYRLPGEPQTHLVYAHDRYTGQEHRRTITEVVSIASHLGIPLGEDEAGAILEKVKRQTGNLLDVTDHMLIRLFTGEDSGPDESMDDDASTALAPAGFGMDEDYEPSGSSAEVW